jgi:PKD repeat protein
VNFTDQSTNSPTAWNWIFGDGGTSTVQNPSYQYTTGGSFTVSLTVSNVSGSNTKIKANYIVVSSIPAPAAQFTGSPTNGNAPLTVDFTDQSTGNPTSWSWTFGDGGTSTAQDPSHEYSTGGSFTVSLMVSNAGGNDSEVKTNYITVSVPPPPPVPDFTANPRVGPAPLTVYFTDLSTGCIDTWKYNADGTGGDDISDSHSGNLHWTYQNPGVFTVILSVRDCYTGKYYSKSRPDYITVTLAPPTAAFTGLPTSGEVPLTVQFTDQSTGIGINSWSWTFGDSGTGTAQNPSHQYAAVGNFTVSLTVSNAAGSNKNTKTNYITVVDTTPPVISCPADVAVECGQSTEPSSTGVATATDNSGLTPTIVSSDMISGACPKVITRTWKATDASGNFATCEQTITVQDTTAPVFTTVPQDMTVESDGAGNAAELTAWLGSAAASDTCGNVTVTNNFGGLSDGCGATGSATVTWTATDECGNSATTSATFTVVDTTAPVFTAVPQDETVESDGAGNAAELNAWLAGAAAGSATITNNFSGLSDGCGATGSATVMWTAADECGNSATTSATFTIVDTTAPVFTAVPQDAVVSRDGNGNTDELNAWLASVVEATDVGGGVEITNNFTSFPYGCGNTGSVTVVWTAEDACGNKATTSAKFTINDPTTAVTYDGDMLLSTAGAPTVNANLIASLRNQSGEVPNIDGEQVTFTLTADGVATIVVTAYTQDGVASAVQALEPAIYTVRITLGCSGLTAQGILVVFNPQGGFATGGGWILPANDGVNTHPNNRANFGFNAKYKDSNPTGNLEFRYTDGYIDLKSTLIDQLVITGGKIVQFKGQATVNRQQGCRFFVKAIDNGEPGTNDTFEIKIWAPGIDPESNSPYERAAGALKGGNIQVHNK